MDQLATILLINSYENGGDAALDASVYWLLKSEEASDWAFWDVHSLEPQRFYNMMCWVLGSDPESYIYLVEDGWIPELRAQTCPREYSQTANSWARLLSPYAKIS